MNKDDLKKIEEELEEEIKKNNEQILLNDERKRVAGVSQFDNKALATLVFSMLPYLILTILAMTLNKNGMMAPITNMIPAENLAFLMMGSSLGLGAIGMKILGWKYKVKERLKAFSTAKTQSELLQEEVKYAVELEKAKNKNNAIRHAKDLLNSNQTILDSLSDDNSISSKTLSQTKEESQERVKDLSSLLKRKQDELDVLTTQKVLHEKFWEVRATWRRVGNTALAGFFGGFFSLMFSGFSLVTVGFVSSSVLIPILAPLIIGTLGVTGYMLKRNKDYRKVFNNLNHELGENALPDKIKDAYEERQKIGTEMDDKMREVVLSIIQFQEQKRTMESLMVDDSKQEQSKESTISKKQYEDQRDPLSFLKEGENPEEEKGFQYTLKP